MSIVSAPFAFSFLSPPLWLRRCGHLPLHLLILLVHAQRRSRERAQLAEMDETALKDVGLTRADMLAELRKSFRQY